MEKRTFFQTVFGSSKLKVNPLEIKTGDFISLQKYDVNSILAQNSVVYMQTQLGFPTDDIRVKLPDKDVSDSIIFEFSDSKGLIYGFYEYIKLDVKSIDKDKLIELYTKDILKETIFKTVHKTFADGNEAFIVTGKHKEKMFDKFNLVVIEGTNLTIFSITAEENYLFSYPEFAYKIFSSYKFIKNKEVRQRILKDYLCFKTTDSWLYWGDSEKGDLGYYTYYTNQSKKFNITVYVTEVFNESIESLKNDYLEREVPYFENSLKFNDIEIKCPGFVFNDFLNYLVKYKTKKFRFCFKVQETDNKQCLSSAEIKDLGYWNEVIDLINSNFYLNL